MKLERLSEEEVKHRKRFLKDHQGFIDGEMGYIFTNEHETKMFFDELYQNTNMDRPMIGFESQMVSDCNSGYVIKMRQTRRFASRAYREKKEDCENYIVFKSNIYEVELI